MLNLFELDENWELVVSPETMGLEPFKKVMEKYKDKSLGTTELLYIYFMVDYRSDFDDIADPSLRSSKILENIHNGNKILIDSVTQKAIDFYTERQPSISLRHLNAVKKALTSIQNALDNIDLSAKIHNPITDVLEDYYDTLAISRIATMIKESPKLVSAVKEMEKQVKTELQEATAHRGSGDKGIYEDE